MKKVNWVLYRAVSVVNLLAFISGIAYGWTSPTLPKLNNKDDLTSNPFGRPITPFEASWLTSIISAGASVGPFLGALVVDRIGRKKTLLSLAFPIIVSHLILAFSTDINLFYVSRFLLGLSCGCIYSIVPMYVGEIAEDTNRGGLGCFMSMMCTVGTTMCFIIGPYMSIRVFCLLVLIPSGIFVLTFGLLVPESPYYLLMVKKDEEAKIALSKLRRNFISKELEEMRKNVEFSNKNQLTFTDALQSQAIKKGLMIGSGLMFFQQFSGITVVISYMQPIFDAAGSEIPPEIPPMVVGCLQLVANMTTSQLVDRLGCKILLLSSLIGGFVSHTLLGVYFYLKTNGYDDITSYLFWLPICCLIFYVMLFMSGLGPVTWALIGELFPPHFRNYASTFTTFICLFLAFGLTLFFPNINQLIGMAFSFWLFAASCAVGILFVWRIVPETKGKSLHDIQILLGNKN